VNFVDLFFNLKLNIMPCYDGRDSEPRVVYQNGVDPQPLKYEISQLEDKIKRLEAGLCAIISELEKKGIANEIISQASKSGLVDLMAFWSAHSKEDETRLAKELHKFSEHEQEILKTLLNKK